MMLRVKVAVLISLGILYAQKASATTVVRASTEQLRDASDIIIYGAIADVRDVGKFRTQITLEVLEFVKGGAQSREFTWELPGGTVDGKTMAIPGMPRFRPGDEVVVLLEATPHGGYALTGMFQGVFFVHRDVFGQPFVQRASTGGAMLVGHDDDVWQPPSDLASLLALLRTHR